MPSLPPPQWTVSPGLTDYATALADMDARAAAIVAFETQIARAHWTRIDSRDADKTYNKLTLAALQKAAPGFDFAAYFKANGLTPTELLVAQPSAITGEAALIAKAPIGVLKDALLLRSLWPQPQ